ncbi:MAG: hypothetical protein ACJ75J_17005 [Cytophagaceae bacterium]
MKLAETTKNLLSGLSEVIKKTDQADYSKNIEVLSGSTIGQHIRHIIEFYECLRRGAETGIVNYDKRERNKETEENKFIALSRLQRISESIPAWNSGMELILEVGHDPNHDHPERIPTNLERELAYNIEHVVHHMAIIKIGILNLCPSIELPAGFGLASSTLKYQQQNVHSNLSA